MWTATNTIKVHKSQHDVQKVALRTILNVGIEVQRTKFTVHNCSYPDYSGMRGSIVIAFTFLSQFEPAGSGIPVHL